MGENARNYRFRLRFKVAQRGILKTETSPTKQLTFERRGRPITFRAVYADDICAADTFEFSMGGFKNPDDAKVEAALLRKSLLTVGAALGNGLGVSVGTNTNLEKPEMKTQFNCEDQVAGAPVQLVSNKADILIIQQSDQEDDYISYEGFLDGVLQAVTAKGFFNACLRAEDKSKNFSSRQLMVVELYNAAYFETSRHAKFLTWMLTVESVLKLRPRPKRIIEIVDKFKLILAKASDELHKSKDMTLAEEKSIEGLKTTLKYAVDESISQGMSRLAAEVGGAEMFCGRSAEQFMKRCYTVRSQLVHNGNIGKYELEYEELVNNFEVLARHIVMNFLGIVSFEIPASDMADCNLNIGTGFV